MNYNPQNPVIVQGDRSILLETDNPRYEEARDALALFAELVKSPEHIHTYRITPLSLWNAASAGMTADEIINALLEFAKYEVPQNITQDVKDYVQRYGRLKLIKQEPGDNLCLFSLDEALMVEIYNHKVVEPFIEAKIDKNNILVKKGMRGRLKQVLIKIGFPVEDLAGYVEGEPLNINLLETSRSKTPFNLRIYQRDAVDIFYAGGSSRGGSGVLVLPCGAGKTIIGIGVLTRLKQHTLILCTNITALRQWRDEILDKTDLPPSQIGEYSGEFKNIKPVTITTYQILTYRRKKDEDFVHMNLFNLQSWGLIIYDEVHLLPAPVFRAVAEIQGKRRLGLTATLVREDEKEDDVFSLIGPKKFDVPWKVLERQGWIAKALCTEIRIPLPEAERLRYAVADTKSKFRIASENPAKIEAVNLLIEKHKDDNILIIGQYLDQLDILAKRFNAPIITGKTPNKDRERIYGDFKSGKLKRLIVSKVANFAIDLPDANVAVQVSGTFGSRQEEAQRLGRVLRPKAEGNFAFFYSLVTKGSKDQEFAENRQLFLTEQGYRYRIISIDGMNQLAEKINQE
ncbi:MAG TPA: helicase-associated domain-containing protein [Candidatus Sumerlaeota bacterium]|nr:helicase-associated domain-containing protein [Candidatus Sumerlaeota bacterium]HRU53530.1 helicase-associated domain-containing protein [Candidatus Sumerlaeia bacterium]